MLLSFAAGRVLVLTLMLTLIHGATDPLSGKSLSEAHSAAQRQ
jgi:hypothetical protein